MEALNAALVLQDRGISNDRYADGKGAWQSDCMIPGERREIARHITLIAQEAIDRANEELLSLSDQLDEPHIMFTPEYTRRNIVTYGIEDLRELIGRTIKIGSAKLDVLEECVPCDRPRLMAVRNGMVERAGKLHDERGQFRNLFASSGGLRAAAISGGVIKRGMEIEVGE